jgi:hypothetical protein
MGKTKLKKTAARMHTHRVVFTANDDIEVALRALMGQSTQAIVDATGLNPGQVQYRVTKAGINRWEFRHGRTPLANRMIEMGRGIARRQVDNEIAPKFQLNASK